MSLTLCAMAWSSCKLLCVTQMLSQQLAQKLESATTSLSCLLLTPCHSFQLHQCPKSGPPSVCQIRKKSFHVSQNILCCSSTQLQDTTVVIQTSRYNSCDAKFDLSLWCRTPLDLSMTWTCSTLWQWTTSTWEPWRTSPSTSLTAAWC
jgi:hypothetical protein